MHKSWKTGRDETVQRQCEGAGLMRKTRLLEGEGEVKTSRQPAADGAMSELGSQMVWVPNALPVAKLHRVKLGQNSCLPNPECSITVIPVASVNLRVPALCISLHL